MKNKEIEKKLEEIMRILKEHCPQDFCEHDWLLFEDDTYGERRACKKCNLVK